jgi:hypothetical protein
MWIRNTDYQSPFSIHFVKTCKHIMVKFVIYNFRVFFISVWVCFFLFKTDQLQKVHSLDNRQFRSGGIFKLPEPGIPENKLKIYLYLT